MDKGCYLKRACDYVHLNPVRAHLLGTEDRLLAYPWSSFGWYLAAPEHRPGWMRVDRLLGEHGIQPDSAAGRQEFERHVEARSTRLAHNPSVCRNARSTSAIGSEPITRLTALSKTVARLSVITTESLNTPDC